MSVEKIGNMMDLINTNTRVKTNIKKQPNQQLENTHGDIVSLGSSEEGADNILKIHKPPLFPIGDTQSIFKIDK